MPKYSNYHNNKDRALKKVEVIEQKLIDLTGLCDADMQKDLRSLFESVQHFRNKMLFSKLVNGVLTSGITK